jgi:hypothetical protein
MIAPRYGDECSCDLCTVAGVRGQRTIEVQPGVYAHGRDLARLYSAIAKFQSLRFVGKPKLMPEAIIQTDLDGKPL